MSTDDTARLERIEGKLDLIIDKLHSHDLRLVPLEADAAGRRTFRKWVAGIGASIVAGLAIIAVKLKLKVIGQ
ncbi:MAG TPA: hypothetical protein VN962_06745 [Polyangia bacterium]|nr:hypothetical protein [Polyangia bacterium]